MKNFVGIGKFTEEYCTKLFDKILFEDHIEELGFRENNGIRRKYLVVRDENRLFEISQMPVSPFQISVHEVEEKIVKKTVFVAKRSKKNSVSNNH